jgi:primase-polymerase (primpol)-like protein
MSAAAPLNGHAAAATIDRERLPPALAPLVAMPHWVLWRWETKKDGKRTKVPYQAKRPGTKASSTDPRTWSDYATAVAAAGGWHRLLPAQLRLRSL